MRNVNVTTLSKAADMERTYVLGRKREKERQRRTGRGPGEARGIRILATASAGIAFARCGAARSKRLIYERNAALSRAAHYAVTAFQYKGPFAASKTGTVPRPVLS
jgi:hypothetical protein